MIGRTNEDVFTRRVQIFLDDRPELALIIGTDISYEWFAGGIATLSLNPRKISSRVVQAKGAGHRARNRLKNWHMKMGLDTAAGVIQRSTM